MFGYLTESRKGAISKLSWDDVHDGAVYLAAKNPKNTRPYFVPLIDELADLIERRRADRAMTNLVFHRGGAPVAEMRKSWATATKKAGCPGRFSHDFRRGCAQN